MKDKGYITGTKSKGIINQIRPVHTSKGYQAGCLKKATTPPPPPAALSTFPAPPTMSLSNRQRGLGDSNAPDPWLVSTQRNLLDTRQPKRGILVRYKTKKNVRCIKFGKAACDACIEASVLEVA